MPDIPTLYVCHGDTGGPKFHPCRRVQEALNASGIQYEKVIAAHGNPIPFLRRGSRDDLRAATGDNKLPALKLPNGTVLTHSRAILAWLAEQPRAPQPSPPQPGATQPSPPQPRATQPSPPQPGATQPSPPHPAGASQRGPSQPHPGAQPNA